MNSSRKSGERPSLLWVTDPWTTLDHSRDTTLRLAEECLAQNVETYWCDVKTLRWEGGAVRLDARRIEGVYPGRAEASFRLAPSETHEPSDFSQLHYRTDPPVDLAYLHPLQLLVLGTQGRENRTRILNPPEVLFSSNEKTEAGLLGELMPPSIVSSLWERLEDFGKREGQTVLKPLHEAQSHGIEKLDWRTEEGQLKARENLRLATADFERPVLLQRYLPGIQDGELRLWFLDGKLLAYVKKLPLAGDFRVNMDRGSRLAPAEPTPREKKAAQRIGRHLKARKIRLAAIDLIEGLATDFNFTSPGLIPQMEAVLGINLAQPIIRALSPVAGP